MNSTYKLRHSDDDRLAWQRAADEAHMELAPWIRMVLNQASSEKPATISCPSLKPKPDEKSSLCPRCTRIGKAVCVRCLSSANLQT